MGVNVQGVEELMYLIRQGGEKAVKGAVAQMREEAKNIRDLAQKMAPVDEGDLEASIRMRESGGGRNSLGRFAAKTFVVEVDGNKAAGRNREGNIVTVGDYAYIVHEHMAPFGYIRQGPKTQAKQLANPDVLVGGLFLDRAVEEISRGMIGRIVEKTVKELD